MRPWLAAGTRRGLPAGPARLWSTGCPLVLLPSTDFSPPERRASARQATGKAALFDCGNVPGDRRRAEDWTRGGLMGVRDRARAHRNCHAHADERATRGGPDAGPAGRYPGVPTEATLLCRRGRSRGSIHGPAGRSTGRGTGECPLGEVRISVAHKAARLAGGGRVARREGVADRFVDQPFVVTRSRRALGFQARVVSLRHWDHRVFHINRVIRLGGCAAARVVA